jgi:hypothetical protein
MDLGRSKGGLPPDSIVDDTADGRAATEKAIDDWHDAAPDSMLRVAVAPCSPFSATARLMTEAAALARRRGVRLHTPLAETAEEAQFCRETQGCTAQDRQAQPPESTALWINDLQRQSGGPKPRDDAAPQESPASRCGFERCSSPLPPTQPRDRRLDENWDRKRHDPR